MSYEFITITRDGAITTITLNRPEAMNSLHAPMHQELQAAFDAFAADETQHVGVVTGAGERAFCAGSDLKDAAASKGIGGGAYPKCGYAGLIERFDLAKPLIAAVNGVALGGGVHRLARQIGLKQAMGIILTSQSVTAAEGARLGFVNEVVPKGALKAAVARWCDLILKGAPVAIRASKETVMRGLNEPSLADAIRNQKAHPAFAAWLDSEDIKEGPRAFAEKRPPRWSGR